jgi:hypothetical protein
MESTHSRSQSLLYQIKQEGETQPFSRLLGKKYTTFFAVATLLVASGTVVWILNIMGLIPGPWSSVFGAIFTSIGIIIALLNALLVLAPTHRGQA